MIKGLRNPRLVSFATAESRVFTAGFPTGLSVSPHPAGRPATLQPRAGGWVAHWRWDETAVIYCRIILFLIKGLF